MQPEGYNFAYYLTDYTIELRISVFIVCFINPEPRK